MTPPVDPRLLRRSRPVRRVLLLVAALGVATAVALLLQALVVAHVVGERFAGHPVAGLVTGIVAVLVLRAVLVRAQSVLAVRAAARVQAELRTELVDDLLDPRRQGPRPDAATVVALLGPGLGQLEPWVGRFLPQLAVTAVVPPAVVVALLLTDPLSGVVVAVTVPLVVGFLVLVGLWTRERLDRRWQALTRLGRHFAGVLDAAVVLKVFGRRDAGVREIGERHREAAGRSLRSAFVSSLVLELFATLSVALVAVTVGLRLVHGSVTLTDALVVLLLAPEAYAPVRRLGALFHDGVAGADAVRQALDVLDHPVHPGRRTAAPAGTTALDLAGVRVVHPDRRRAALALDHAVVLPGVATVVRGPSGSGKSTLLAVLLGLQVPDRGTVTAGGVPVAEIDPVRWRDGIAWVPQQASLVAGTLAENLRLAAPAATDEELRDALIAVGATDLGLDRRVVDDGGGLSTGERRRVAVARAVLRVRVHGATLLLVDEPTAGLDVATEDTVLQAVRALGVTTVLVTHRSAGAAAGDRAIDLVVAEDEATPGGGLAAPVGTAVAVPA